MLAQVFLISQNWSTGTFQTTGADKSVHPSVHLKFQLSMSPGSSFFCRAWRYCCICRRWPQLYGSDPQFILVTTSPGLRFYWVPPTAHSLLGTETRGRHNFHVAAADFFARKNIFTLFFLVCFNGCYFYIIYYWDYFLWERFNIFNSDNNFSNCCHFLPMFLHFGIEPNYMF